MKPAPSSAAGRSSVRSNILAGVIGGLLGYTATNAWFYFLAPAIMAGVPLHGFMPEPFAFLLIDIFVSVGAGYAAALAGQNLIRLQGASPPRPFWLLLYAVILGVGISLIANMVLVFMVTI